jgi:hypothetical protein
VAKTRGKREFSYTTLGLMCLQCTNATHLTCFAHPATGSWVGSSAIGQLNRELDTFYSTPPQVHRTSVHFTTDVVVLRQRKVCLELVLCNVCGLAHAVCCLPISSHHPRTSKGKPRTPAAVSETRSSVAPPPRVNQKRNSGGTTPKKRTSKNAQRSETKRQKTT